MICVFYAQTVWPSTLPHTNGLACNFYAQTVWPPTKLATQRVGEEFEATPQHPKKATPAPPRPWPPTHPYRRSDQELATPPAQVVRKNPRRHSYCDDMDGSAAMEGWGALAAEGLYFL